MKYLFIIQGEGRGHLTQALSLQEMLIESGHEVVGLLVGKSASRSLPEFFQEKATVKVEQFESPNFLPTSANRKVNLPRSVLYNVARLPSYWESMCFLRKAIKESGADVVVNFYELLTGLTYLFFDIQIPYYCVGHQYAFLHKDFKMPLAREGKLLLLNFFTKLTSLRCRQRLALSFYEMEGDEENKIVVVPPLLRKDLFKLTPGNEKYILGYMVNAGYADDVKEFHKSHPDLKLHFFWDKEDVQLDENLLFHHISDKTFLEKMQNCQAYATTAGFESVCEAIYLGKPILMVPVHVEQECNAFDASRIGAGIVSDDFDMMKLYRFSLEYEKNVEFRRWISNAKFRIVNQLSASETSNVLSSKGLMSVR